MIITIKYLARTDERIDAKPKQIVKNEESDGGPKTEGGEMLLNGGTPGDVQVYTRKTYQVQPIRTIGGRRSAAIEKYDAEEHWRLGLGPDERAMGEMGPRL